MSVLRRRLYSPIESTEPWFKVYNGSRIDRMPAIDSIRNMKTGEEVSHDDNAWIVTADAYPATFVFEWSKDADDVSGLFYMNVALLEVSPMLLRPIANTLMDVSSMFRSSGIRYIPTDLFKGCYNLSYFSQCFAFMYSCTGRTPLVDGKELWDAYPNASHYRCFYNSTSLDNYREIPEEWRN